MSHPSNPMPVRPADVDPDATLAALLDDYHRHLIPVVAARVGGGAGRDVAAHALAALATAHAITNDLMGERRRIAVDALAHGADVAAVGGACGGLAPDEVAALVSGGGR